MYIKTQGIVLHTTRYSETSVISKIYTERLGLVSYIIKGVRSSKSKTKAALLQPLTLLEMEVSHRENKNLQFIKEFRRAHTYVSLPFDTLKSSIAMFLLEVISKSIREHEQNEEMFNFIFQSFVQLDNAPKLNPDFHLFFLLRFTNHLGFFPHNNFTVANCFFEMQEGVFTATEPDKPTILDKEQSAGLRRLLQANFSEKTSVMLNRHERKQVMRSLLKYYQLHLENFSLKSPDILEEILE